MHFFNDHKINKEVSMKKNIKHFFFFLSLAAGTIHFVNRFINMTADIKNILKSENGNFYDWKNGQIYYTRRGSGSPLLLIHDLDPVSSSYEWCKVIRKLEKKHTVYTLDLLGCGRSAKPYLTYTNYLYVQLITDFIKNVIGEKTDIIASNESISFVTLACNMNKDLANSIIAINPTSLKELHITTDKYASVKKTLLELPVIGTFLYNIKVSNTNITKDFREEYYARPQLVSSKLIDAYYEAAHMNFSHGKYLMASMEANYTKNSIEHALKKLETPIYVIESRNMKDAIAIADSYKKTNSRNEIVYLSNCKKYPQLEIADKVAEAIDMFLKLGEKSIADYIQDSSVGHYARLIDRGVDEVLEKLPPYCLVDLTAGRRAQSEWVEWINRTARMHLTNDIAVGSAGRYYDICKRFSTQMLEEDKMLLLSGL